MLAALVLSFLIHAGTESPSGLFAFGWRIQKIDMEMYGKMYGGGVAQGDAEKQENVFVDTKLSRVLTIIKNVRPPRGHADGDMFARYSKDESLAALYDNGHRQTYGAAIVATKSASQVDLWKALKPVLVKYAEQHRSGYSKSDLSKLNYVISDIILGVDTVDVNAVSSVTLDPRQIGTLTKFKVAQTPDSVKLKFDSTKPWDNKAGI